MYNSPDGFGGSFATK